MLKGLAFMAAFSLILIVTGQMAFRVSPAGAYEDPSTKLALQPQYIESAESMLLENSPRRIPGIELTAESHQSYEALIDSPPEASTAVEGDLESVEAPTLLAESDVWVWSYLPTVTLAAGSFWAGWEIGSTIWGVFFEESEPKVETSYHEATEWDPWPPNWVLFSDSGGEALSPNAYGFRGHAGTYYTGNITDTGYCEAELFGDGIRIFSPGWYPSYGCGTNYQRNYALWKPIKPINCGMEAYLCPGIEPVPYKEKYQPEAPTASELREDVEKELATTGYPEFNRFFNYLAQPENFPDPRVTKKDVNDEERQCDRGIPTFENPGGNSSPSAFSKKQEASFSVGNLPKGYEETGPVYLRWGVTDWEPSRETYSKTVPYLDLWGGWGYRHIVAKHGWNALDRIETEDALDSAIPEPTPKSSKFTYLWPDPEGGSGSVKCDRKVIVDFGAGEGDPSPRGIVSSYNIVEVVE